MFELVESEHGAGKLQADVIRRSDLDLVKTHQKSECCPPQRCEGVPELETSLAGQTSVALRAADYPVREDAPGPVAGGEKLPPRAEANLVFTEALEATEADRNRKAWMAEWLRMFNDTPDGS